MPGDSKKKAPLSCQKGRPLVLCFHQRPFLRPYQRLIRALFSAFSAPYQRLISAL